MNRFGALAVAATLWLLMPMASAQVDRMPVELDHSGDDVVGQQLAFELREAIRGSSAMRLVVRGESAPSFVVSLVTVESFKSSPGTGTAAAVLLLVDGNGYPLRGFHVGALVQTCGANRVQDCARQLVAQIDGMIEYVKKDWPSLAAKIKAGTKRK